MEKHVGIWVFSLHRVHVSYFALDPSDCRLGLTSVLLLSNVLALVYVYMSHLLLYIEKNVWGFLQPQAHFPSFFRVITVLFLESGA